MVSSGMLRRVALVRTDISEEPGASFIRVTKLLFVIALILVNVTFYLTIYGTVYIKLHYIRKQLLIVKIRIEL
jgi:hypothetical protein